MKTFMNYRWVGLKNIITVLGNGRKVNYSTSLDHNSCSSVKLIHTPVLAKQVTHFIKPENARIIIDMTFGSGGHTRKFLEKSNSVKIVCLDRDPLSYDYAKKLKQEFPSQIIPLHGKFSDLPNLLSIHGILQNSIDAIFFDFGSSSMQFDDPTRGFSLSKDGPLDMRMDPTQPDSFTAADVLAYASENDLYKIFKIYGEEIQARKIARALVEARQTHGFLKRTSELKDLIAAVLNNQLRLDKLGRYSHVSTKVFQALRIFVNNELNEINYGLVLAHRYLKLSGVMVALSFHSLEDTIVKRHVSGNVFDNVANELPLKFYSFSTVFSEDALNELKDSNWRSINKHVIVPDIYEIDSNPRSRSAKLRACVKIK